uniref:Uncharacterized protein n=1 Tax=Chromera velia CCMP2878 TaxID=1169474 RepID=A0A0G4IDP3_9ALVE|eukprot:Cvel_13364.t1-p1 / transcript=Cvel_13364.t1 / gene=Cvel_13364 / organism=Chromera_velia_CCMP2878 / gene_product=hypothetical protein / transcript_product=hypothetical protein / location=Cvel_scaffold909:4232-16234(+) / protein_length=2271 / sequence_SO=supercontig / SO=protein_coding / is_pseudo=false
MDFTEVDELEMLFPFTGMGHGRRKKVVPDVDRDMLEKLKVEEIMRISPKFEPTFGLDHLIDELSNPEHQPSRRPVGQHMNRKLQFLKEPQTKTVQFQSHRAAVREDSQQQSRTQADPHGNLRRRPKQSTSGVGHTASASLGDKEGGKSKRKKIKRREVSQQCKRGVTRESALTRAFQQERQRQGNGNGGEGKVPPVPLPIVQGGGQRGQIALTVQGPAQAGGPPAAAGASRGAAGGGGGDGVSPNALTVTVFLPPFKQNRKSDFVEVVVPKYITVSDLIAAVRRMMVQEGKQMPAGIAAEAPGGLELRLVEEAEEAEGGQGREKGRGAMPDLDFPAVDSGSVVGTLNVRVFCLCPGGSGGTMGIVEGTEKGSSVGGDDAVGMVGGGRMGEAAANGAGRVEGAGEGLEGRVTAAAGGGGGGSSLSGGSQSMSLEAKTALSPDTTVAVDVFINKTSAGTGRLPRQSGKGVPLAPSAVSGVSEEEEYFSVGGGDQEQEVQASFPVRGEGGGGESVLFGGNVHGGMSNANADSAGVPSLVGDPSLGMGMGEPGGGFERGNGRLLGWEQNTDSLHLHGADGSAHHHHHDLLGVASQTPPLPSIHRTESAAQRGPLGEEEAPHEVLSLSPSHGDFFETDCVESPGLLFGRQGETVEIRQAPLDDSDDERNPGEGGRGNGGEFLETESAPSEREAEGGPSHPHWRHHHHHHHNHNHHQPLSASPTTSGGGGRGPMPMPMLGPQMAAHRPPLSPRHPPLNPAAGLTGSLARGLSSPPHPISADAPVGGPRERAQSDAQAGAPSSRVPRDRSELDHQRVLSADHQAQEGPGRIQRGSRHSSHGQSGTAEGTAAGGVPVSGRRERARERSRTSDVTSRALHRPPTGVGIVVESQSTKPSASKPLRQSISAALIYGSRPRNSSSFNNLQQQYPHGRTRRPGESPGPLEAGGAPSSMTPGPMMMTSDGGATLRQFHLHHPDSLLPDIAEMTSGGWGVGGSGQTPAGAPVDAHGHAGVPPSSFLTPLPPYTSTGSPSAARGPMNMNPFQQFPPPVFQTQGQGPMPPSTQPSRSRLGSHFSEVSAGVGGLDGPDALGVGVGIAEGGVTGEAPQAADALGSSMAGLLSQLVQNESELPLETTIKRAISQPLVAKQPPMQPPPPSGNLLHPLLSDPSAPAEALRTTAAGRPLGGAEGPPMGQQDGSSGWPPAQISAGGGGDSPTFLQQPPAGGMARAMTTGGVPSRVAHSQGPPPLPSARSRLPTSTSMAFPSRQVSSEALPGSGAPGQAPAIPSTVTSASMKPPPSPLTRRPWVGEKEKEKGIGGSGRVPPSSSGEAEKEKDDREKEKEEGGALKGDWKNLLSPGRSRPPPLTSVRLPAAAPHAGGAGGAGTPGGWVEGRERETDRLGRVLLGSERDRDREKEMTPRQRERGQSHAEGPSGREAAASSSSAMIRCSHSQGRGLWALEQSGGRQRGRDRDQEWPQAASGGIGTALGGTPGVPSSSSFRGGASARPYASYAQLSAAGGEPPWEVAAGGGAAGSAWGESPLKSVAAGQGPSGTPMQAPGPGAAPGGLYAVPSASLLNAGGGGGTSGTGNGTVVGSARDEALAEAFAAWRAHDLQQERRRAGASGSGAKVEGEGLMGEGERERKDRERDRGSGGGGGGFLDIFGLSLWGSSGRAGEGAKRGGDSVTAGGSEAEAEEAAAALVQGRELLIIGPDPEADTQQQQAQPSRSVSAVPGPPLSGEGLGTPEKERGRLSLRRAQTREIVDSLEGDREREREMPTPVPVLSSHQGLRQRAESARDSHERRPVRTGDRVVGGAAGGEAGKEIMRMRSDRLATVASSSPTPHGERGAPSSSASTRTVKETLVCVPPTTTLGDVLLLVDTDLEPERFVFFQERGGQKKRLDMEFVVEDLPPDTSVLRLERRQMRRPASMRIGPAGSSVGHRTDFLRPPLSLFNFTEASASLTTEYRVKVSVFPAAANTNTSAGGEREKEREVWVDSRPCLLVVARDRVCHRRAPQAEAQVQLQEAFSQRYQRQQQRLLRERQRETQGQGGQITSLQSPISVSVGTPTIAQGMAAQGGSPESGGGASGSGWGLSVGLASDTPSASSAAAPFPFPVPLLQSGAERDSREGMRFPQQPAVPAPSLASLAEVPSFEDPRKGKEASTGMGGAAGFLMPLFTVFGRKRPPPRSPFERQVGEIFRIQLSSESPRAFSLFFASEEDGDGRPGRSRSGVLGGAGGGGEWVGGVGLIEVRYETETPSLCAEAVARLQFLWELAVRNAPQE